MFDRGQHQTSKNGPKIQWFQKQTNQNQNKQNEEEKKSFFINRILVTTFFQ